jgi:hypothetical protein
MASEQQRFEGKPSSGAVLKLVDYDGANHDLAARQLEPEQDRKQQSLVVPIHHWPVRAILKVLSQHQSTLFRTACII